MTITKDSKQILQARWLRHAFLIFQDVFLAEHGRLPFVKEWAVVLNVNDKSLSQWMNGTRLIPQDKAYIICEKTEDYSLLEILDYPMPSSRAVPLESLPPELRERLRDALVEISETIRKRAINTESDMAAELSKDILEKYGFTVNSIEKDK